MKMIRSTPLLALVAASVLLGGCAARHHNPVDAKSNPDQLRFNDVQATRTELGAPPFLREGVMDQPARLAQLKAGTPMAQVQSLLGQPLKQGNGPRGTEWDYDLKFQLPQSQNFLVCQYKVVFDAQAQVVREAVWRRQQCQDLVAQAARQAS